MPVTLTFEVYKLVFDDSKYVVQQVKTLGDQTLFVGDNQSMSVSASRFSWCRPNSIQCTKQGTTAPLQCHPQHSSEEHISEPATWILPPINGLC
ncbi:hypothetical protein ACLB2K_045599 [Fragaria x ananassa]